MRHYTTAELARLRTQIARSIGLRPRRTQTVLRCGNKTYVCPHKKK